MWRLFLKFPGFHNEVVSGLQKLVGTAGAILQRPGKQFAFGSHFVFFSGPEGLPERKVHVNYVGESLHNSSLQDGRATELLVGSVRCHSRERTDS